LDSTNLQTAILPRRGEVVASDASGKSVLRTAVDASAARYTSPRLGEGQDRRGQDGNRKGCKGNAHVDWCGVDVQVEPQVGVSYIPLSLHHGGPVAVFGGRTAINGRVARCPPNVKVRDGRKVMGPIMMPIRC
jgi:hypothetical protein